jgi:Fe-S-cluster containining protein
MSRTPNPCFSCDTDCCSHYSIFVTGEDVVRLSVQLELPPLEFVTTEVEVLTEELPEVTLDGVPAQLVLHSRDGRCCMQDPDSHMCTVHDVRPFICRLYPLEVEDDRYLKLNQRPDVICPEPFPLRPHDEQVLLHDARAFWEQELPAWEQTVARWNREHGDQSLEAFLRSCLP